MDKRFVFPLALCLALSCLTAQAKVELPSVIADNMVLQRETEVALWGKAKPSHKVVVSPSWTRSKTVVTSDADGRWSAKLATPAAGGPYSITFSDGDKVVVDNVLIGEVWFASGQSNMEMPVRGFNGQPVEGSADVIFGARRDTPIRMCTVRRRVSATPLEKCDAKWLENTPDAVAATSAVAYFFALCLQNALDVPVGVLISDWGGTGIEPWMSRETLQAEFPGEVPLDHLDAPELPKMSQYRACTLFNGMVAPLIPFTFKGMIWYQGESNRGFAELYCRLHPSYVKMMRRLWNNDRMPFYFVQIAPYCFKGSAWDNTAARLMEAQARSMEDIPHSGMVVTADIGQPWCIHPAKKKEVGQRLAALALKKDYGMPLWGAESPMLDKWEVRDDGKILLSFINNDSGLGPVNEDIEAFEVAGEDRVFHPATGRVQKGYATILVTCPEVSAPVAVRYGFHNYAPGVFHNGAGLPLAPFRTDDW